MAGPLVQEEMKVTLSTNKEEREFEILADKYLRIIEKINKLFYEEDFDLYDALIVLDSVITGLEQFMQDGYTTIRQIENI